MAFYTLDEIKAVYDDQKKPVINRIVANQFYLALKNGNYSKIKEIMEYILGKPLQEIKADVTQDPPLVIVHNGKKLNL